MDFVSDILNSVGDILNIVGGLNWEAIFQLTFVALIMLSGPVVIFLLAARGGDL